MKQADEGLTDSGPVHCRRPSSQPSYVPLSLESSLHSRSERFYDKSGWHSRRSHHSETSCLYHRCYISANTTALSDASALAQ